MSKRVVVIGGGLGGMAAALRLAHMGMRVVLCERCETLGGKMNVWESGGYRFDTGPSLITMPWIFEELFTLAGERMGDHLALVRVKPLARYVYPDGTTFDYTTELPAWLDTLRSIERSDEDGFMRFMQLGASIYELSKATFLKQYPTSPPDTGALEALRHFPIRGAWGNYHASVCKHFKSPYLRQLFDRYPTYVGSSPYKCPATLAIIPYIEWAYAGWYVSGGLYRIVDVMSRFLDRAGVETRTHATVTRIVTQNGRATGVELEDGTTFSADIVVMNGDASCTAQLLDRDRPNELPLRDRSLSGFVWLVAIRGELPEMHHHTVYFSNDYQREFAELFDERQFPNDPTVYVNIPSRTDRSRAPLGGETLFIMANSPATGDTRWDDAEVFRAKSRVLERLAASGFPDISARIVSDTVYSPRTIAEKYLMPGGSIYGQHSHGWLKAFLRPRNKDNHVGGLYYVGGSTHPGGGTPIVLLSAKITTELIAKHEAI
jgi:phytoene desaturase